MEEKRSAIKQAVVEVKKLSQSERAQILYDDRQKALWREKDVLKTALSIRNREIIENGFQAGLTIEQISKVTGLSVEEVEKEMKNITAQS